MIEMELLGVRVELPSNAPIVLLRELSGQHRMLPIFIGPAEATSIAFALEGAEPPRPMTHDLMVILLDELGAELESVVVTELREKTFYAELHLVTGDGERSVSCRPSDAIALAVRTSTPIFAEEAVVDESGFVEDETDEAAEGESAADASQAVEEFREFLDSVNPEDFA